MEFNDDRRDAAPFLWSEPILREFGGRAPLVAENGSTPQMRLLNRKNAATIVIVIVTNKVEVEVACGASVAWLAISD